MGILVTMLDMIPDATGYRGDQNISASATGKLMRKGVIPLPFYNV